MLRIRSVVWAAWLVPAALLSGVAEGLADWPVVRGNAQRTGYVPASIKAPFGLSWVRHFPDERLGTAMEPIVAGGRVFAATHSGNLYALNATNGTALWRFQAHGPFLHSPAVASGLVIAACSDGRLYCVGADDGKLRWHFESGRGGFSASPVFDENVIFVGSRAGDFFALNLQNGRPLWQRPLDAPVRQSAAVARGRVFITTEDLRVHCLEAMSGRELWVSEALVGQTVRDYYPIIVDLKDRSVVIVRTNPILNMSQQTARDRRLLCQNAGVDDSDWRKIDAWIKSEAARGTPELWQEEQKAVIAYLREEREARTFAVLDAESGRNAATAPVLWIAGCQAVGAPPALTEDRRLLTFYRTAYGNWSHGVAPLVGLGLLDLTENRIAPLFHQAGAQPPWNTFWGTADESQNFTIAGETVLIAHQGTLSGFDLRENKLFRIWGERDTYGGFRNLPWALNEWHGPARGGVAVDENRIYWLTGSRILCLVTGEEAAPAEDMPIDSSGLSTEVAPRLTALKRADLDRLMHEGIGELLENRWAPLMVQPGLAGRDFSFDDSSEMFEALAWCYPHLNRVLRREVKLALAEQWLKSPPWTKEAWYPLNEGEPRELFWTPSAERTRAGQDKPPHPFGNLHSVWLYAQRCEEWPRVLSVWPQLKSCFEEFQKSGWKLDPAKGDAHANRYLASLLAFSRIGERAGDREAFERATAKMVETSDALIEWWQRVATNRTLGSFKGSSGLDHFIGKGEGLSFRIAPHRHKVALLMDLTPEVAERVRSKAPEAVNAVWQSFNVLYRTWPLAGEERQVHSGENFVDPPDLGLGAFKALAWLQGASKEELIRRVDLPFCRADLYFLTKLALALEPERK